MAELIRAEHEVFGVCDVPDNDFYRDNGWKKVDEQTTTAAEQQIADQSAAGQYDPAEHTVEEVTAYLATADAVEQARVITAERADKARVGVLGYDGA